MLTFMLHILHPPRSTVKVNFPVFTIPFLPPTYSVHKISPVDHPMHVLPISDKSYLPIFSN